MKTPKFITLTGESTEKLLVDLMIALTIRGKTVKMSTSDDDKPLDLENMPDYYVLAYPYMGKTDRELQIYDRMVPIDHILDDLGLA